MRCKHFWCITFVIPREKDAHDIYQSLIQLSQPCKLKCACFCCIKLFACSIVQLDQLYCFQYKASNEYFSKQDGWRDYSLEDEFQRMITQSDGGVQECHWTRSTLNEAYEVGFVPNFFSLIIFFIFSSVKHILVFSIYQSKRVKLLLWQVQTSDPKDDCPF